MAMLCALDWRHGLVNATVTCEADGSVRVVLGQGPDELVLHLSRDSLEGLTFAGLTCPRKRDSSWDLTDRRCG